MEGANKLGDDLNIAKLDDIYSSNDISIVCALLQVRRVSLCNTSSPVSYIFVPRLLSSQ
jgi:hypothetical protein